MARERGPRFKLCRRLGLNVVGHPKAMNRSNIQNSRAGRKLSDYGTQLLEKQRLRAYYGVLEKQMLRYVKDAFSSKEMPSEVLVRTLESRLDNMVFRMGFANSLRAARQMVNHGHVLVDGKKVNIPSFALSPGSQVVLREKSRNSPNYIDAIQSNGVNLLPYIEKDLDNYKGTYVRYPERHEIPIDINDQLIVEYYSK
ncbi:MAG: 30S ribosomal protein S4 [Clostridium sp.]